MRDLETEELLKAVSKAAEAAARRGVKVQAIVWEAADGGLKGRTAYAGGMLPVTEADRA